MCKAQVRKASTREKPLPGGTQRHSGLGNRRSLQSRRERAVSAETQAPAPASARMNWSPRVTPRNLRFSQDPSACGFRSSRSGTENAQRRVFSPLPPDHCRAPTMGVSARTEGLAWLWPPSAPLPGPLFPGPGLATSPVGPAETAERSRRATPRAAEG